MSPEPFAAITNAIEHYRIDEIMISTLAGKQSVWLEQGLIDRVQARSPTCRSSTTRPRPRARPRAGGAEPAGATG